jgi:Collagen triple helix repeat (20 copies)
LTTLMLMSPVAPGANCATGGVRISAGRDLDRSGVLDSGEEQASDYLCNGATGATGAMGPAGPTGAYGPMGSPGADGTNGANGLNGLVAISPEASGSNCTYGGQRITAGLDSNRSNVLDVGEIVR